MPLPGFRNEVTLTRSRTHSLTQSLIIFVMSIAEMFLVFVICVAVTALSDAAPNIDLEPMERSQSDSEIITTGK